MWYAVHAAMLYKFVGEINQSDFYVYENIYLIDADDASAAKALAVTIATSEVADTTTPALVSGRAARLEFGGIRQVVQVQTASETGAAKITQGSEATYLKLYFSDVVEYNKYLMGQAASCQLS